MSVNWFPGHMVRATRDIQKLMKKVDVVVEVRDARIPFSSACPTVDIPPSMPHVIVLNKADLANANMSQRALEQIGKERAVTAVCGGSGKLQNVHKIIPLCEEVCSKKILGPMHVVIFGVPNTGKSSLINALRGKGQAAKKGARPGLTRSIGCFKVGTTKDPAYVIDTPGILFPATSAEERAGKMLAIVGCIKDTVVRPEDVYPWLLEEFVARGKDVSAISLDHIMQQLGGSLDARAAATYALKLFREGRMGPFTLDHV